MRETAVTVGRRPATRIVTERQTGPLSLHAGCAARRGVGVLLLGRPGIGKSDLLLRLIDRGFDLVADDRVLVEAGQARPPPALAGLIEIRGLGLLRMAHMAPVRIGLAVLLDEPATRLPRPERHPVGVPLLRMAPFAASAPCRIEIALDCLAGSRSLVAGALGDERLPPHP